MWYFSWILGVGLASTFGILNAMWFEMKQDRPGQGVPVGILVDSHDDRPT
jgi:cytochrome bd-I ubiquinol oxidase subunit X